MPHRGGWSPASFRSPSSRHGVFCRLEADLIHLKPRYGISYCGNLISCRSDSLLSGVTAATQLPGLQCLCTCSRTPPQISHHRWTRTLVGRLLQQQDQAIRVQMELRCAPSCSRDLPNSLSRFCCMNLCKSSLHGSVFSAACLELAKVFYEFVCSVPVCVHI
jgi:hypothetical protein